MNRTSVKLKGKYLGTEINQKWWRRYRRAKMLARGNGIFTFDRQSISFHRYLTREPIIIDAEKILGLSSGKWHAGQWGAGKEILKVNWVSDGHRLSSGFTITEFSGNMDDLIQQIRQALYNK